MKKLFLYILFVIFFSCNNIKKVVVLKEKNFISHSPDSSGVKFNNIVDENSAYMNIITYLYFYNGAGVSVGDINNDGLDDIYFVGNKVENKLYLNLGNFKFKDISKSSNTQGEIAQWENASVMADVNGDGWLDIYVIALGNFLNKKIGENKLYINNKDNTFTEMAEKFGLNISSFGTQASFFDFDKDGDLDMYLLNHSIHTLKSFGDAKKRNEKDELGGDKFFRNDNNKFIEITNNVGIYSSALGFGLGLYTGDLNNDNWQDIYVANDFHEVDYLYINQKNGTFKEVGDLGLDIMSRSSMGVDVGDVNNDLLPDIFVVDMLPTEEKYLKSTEVFTSYDLLRLKNSFGYKTQLTQNSLHLNLGNNQFFEIANFANVSKSEWSWSPLIADFDNDGWQDIIIANGITRRPNDLDYINFVNEVRNEYPREFAKGNFDLKLIGFMPSGKYHNFAYKNNGNLKFENKSSDWGFDSATTGTGSAYSDLDNDGDLDLIINNRNSFAEILENKTNNIENKGISIKLFQNDKNYFSIGTKVFLYSHHNTFYREVANVKGFQSSSFLGVHFGLPKNSKIDSIKIIWNNQEEQTEKNISYNPILIIKQNKNLPKNEIKNENKNENNLLKKVNVLQEDFTHSKNEYSDFNDQYLIPEMLSKEGPCVVKGYFNNDNLEDFYVCGGKNQTGKLYIQKNKNFFEVKKGKAFELNSNMDEVVAVTLDIEKDGDMDIVVASLNNEINNLYNTPQVYINNGNGNFEEKHDLLVGFEIQTKEILVEDINGDNYPDLLFLGRLNKLKYGDQSVKSYLLINDGKGNFSDLTIDYFYDYPKGMITSGAFFNMDLDKEKELILVGSWTKPIIYKKINNKYKIQNFKEFDTLNGWWNKVLVNDLDKDGKDEILLLNRGENIFIKPSIIKPVYLYYNDFDFNGSFETIIKYFNDDWHIFSSKDALQKQLPYFKRKFVKYFDFSNANFKNILTEVDEEKSEISQINTLKHYMLKFDKKIEIKELSNLSNLYCFKDGVWHDLNNDGLDDLILVGNPTNLNSNFGLSSNGQGIILFQKEKFNFELTFANKSGFYLKGNVNNLVFLKENKYLVLPINQGLLQVYQILN